MITLDDVVEFEVHKFEAEASGLGWKPGYQPRTIETLLGNKRAFVFRDFLYNRDDVALEDREVVGWRYFQELGCISLTVFND